MVLAVDAELIKHVKADLQSLGLRKRISSVDRSTGIRDRDIGEDHSLAGACILKRTKEERLDIDRVATFRHGKIHQIKLDKRKRRKGK